MPKKIRKSVQEIISEPKSVVVKKINLKSVPKKLIEALSLDTVKKKSVKKIFRKKAAVTKKLKPSILVESKLPEDNTTSTEIEKLRAYIKNISRLSLKDKTNIEEIILDILRAIGKDYGDMDRKSYAYDSLTTLFGSLRDTYKDLSKGIQGIIDPIRSDELDKEIKVLSELWRR
jgi:hypothetical protein